MTLLNHKSHNEFASGDSSVIGDVTGTPECLRRLAVAAASPNATRPPAPRGAGGPYLTHQRDALVVP